MTAASPQTRRIIRLVLGSARTAMFGFAALAIGTGAPEPVRSVELRFGSELDDKNVESVLAGLAVLPRGCRLVFDTVSDNFGVRHFVHGTKYALDALSSRLRGVLPSVRVEPCEHPDDLQPMFSARLEGSRRHMLLRDSKAAHSVSALLATLTEPLGKNERMLLRVVLQSTKTPRLPAKDTQPLLARNRVMPRHRARLQSKYDGPVLATEVLVFAQSNNAHRARSLVNRVLHDLRTCQGEVGHLGARPVGGRTIELSHRSWLVRRQVLSPAELTSLIGWPIGAPSLSGLKLGVGPMLPAPRDLPRAGRLFGASNAPHTADQPLAQPIEGALQHTVIVGPTGSGKSTLVSNLIRQDIHEGRGCLVLDVKGDLIDEILGQIPPHRHGDVILLDPSSKLDQPGLRLFPPGGSDVELSADLVLATLQELFSDSWGVRSSQFFRLGLVTLGAYRQSNLTDLPRLFSDRVFRAKVLSHVGDRYVLAAWQRFDALSNADQAQQLASPMTKLEQLIGRRSLRSVLGQEEPKLHFGEVLARGRIVLVRLSPGQIGAPATRLLAALIMWQFFSAIEARSELAAGKRTPYLAYIDEVAALGSLPLPLEGLLERARGLGVGLTLSPQALSQLSRPLQATVLANVGTFVSFRQTSNQEANSAASALPGIDPAQLAYLDRYEVAMRLSLGPGATTPVMTGATAAPADQKTDADELRKTAAKNWGGKVDEEAVTAASNESAPYESVGSNRRRRTF